MPPILSSVVIGDSAALIRPVLGRMRGLGCKVFGESDWRTIIGGSNLILAAIGGLEAFQSDE